MSEQHRRVGLVGRGEGWASCPTAVLPWLGFLPWSRGLHNFRLPDQFLSKDQLGVAGGVDTSFAASMEDANNETAADGEAAATADEDGMDAALVDDEWVRMPGGPWTARLMRKARQPASTADYRVFVVAVSFDAERFPIYSGGAVKFVNVPGGAPEGIICQMPSKIEAGSQVLMFPLRLSKDGVGADMCACSGAATTARVGIGLRRCLCSPAGTKLLSLLGDLSATFFIVQWSGILSAIRAERSPTMVAQGGRTGRATP